MYYRLKFEIGRRGYTIEKFALMLGISEKSLRNKINGATEFTWSEVLAIRDLIDPNMLLEELFIKENKIA
jgi:hypothetical protein